MYLITNTKLGRMYMRSLIERLSVYLIGLIIKSLGLSLIICSDLGTGAWEGLYVGLSHWSEYSVGRCLFVVGCFLVIFNAWLLKKIPNFYSFITIFILGYLIDFWLTVFQMIVIDGNAGIIVFWLGMLIASFGVSTYLKANFAPTPVDQLMLSISERFQLSMMTSKTIGEVVALSFALYLQGPVGLGTIIVTFLFGPLVEYFHKKNDLL